MEFIAKYTTETLISADKTGKEAKKVTISADFYALGEILQQLAETIEKARLGIK